MTIDERIEALTQSVELLAHMHGDLEKQLNEKMSKLAEAMTRLVAVVENHEHRLRDLEDNQ